MLVFKEPAKVQIGNTLLTMKGEMKLGGSTAVAPRTGLGVHCGGVGPIGLLPVPVEVPPVSGALLLCSEAARAQPGGGVITSGTAGQCERAPDPSSAGPVGCQPSGGSGWRAGASCEKME